MAVQQVCVAAYSSEKWKIPSQVAGANDHVHCFSVKPHRKHKQNRAQISTEAVSRDEARPQIALNKSQYWNLAAPGQICAYKIASGSGGSRCTDRS
jgi:hypothetical protein